MTSRHIDDSGAGPTESLAPGGALLLRDARIIDGTGNPPRDRESILVDDGRIMAVGAPESIQVPREARVLSLGGRTVIPGLIDLHVHSTFASEMKGYVAKGVTSIRFAGIDQVAFRRVRDGLVRGDFLGPRVFTLGPMLDVPPGSWPEWTHFVSTPDEARTAAAAFLDEEGTDGLIVTQGITPALMRPIVEVAHGHGRPVVGQIWRTDGAEAAAIGIDQLDNTSRIAVSREWDGERLFSFGSVAERVMILSKLWMTLDWPATERFMDAMRAADVAYCPTLVTVEQTGGLNHDRIEGDPLYGALFGSEEHAAWAAFKARVRGSWSAEDLERWRAALEPRLEWMRRYRERGGRILAGTDMQFGGIALHRELELLRDVGYSPLELIAIATGGAARAIGVADQLGTIEPGRLADLVVLAGDPSDDLSQLGSIDLVVQEGRIVGGRDATDTR